MDTISVKLVENSDFFSSTEFIALLIAALSLIVSSYAIYLQYKKGEFMFLQLGHSVLNFFMVLIMSKEMVFYVFYQLFFLILEININQ